MTTTRQVRRTDPVRLTVVDEIFLRGHRGLGTPLALQGLWRTADRVDPALLHRVHDALRSGELSRRVVRAGVPGARRSWRRNVRAHPLVLVSEPMSMAKVLAWADAQGEGLDPEFGPGWRLAAAPVEDGGTVIALTCSHVLADARGLIFAASRALARLEEQAPGDNPPESVRAGSDWRDAARLWSIVLGGSLRALRDAGPNLARALHVRPGRCRGDADVLATADLLAGAAGPPAVGEIADRSGAPAACADNCVAHHAPRSALAAHHSQRHSHSHSHSHSHNDPVAVHSVVARFDAAAWDRLAAEQGGTANSLFIHLVAAILRDTTVPRDAAVSRDAAISPDAADYGGSPAPLRATVPTDATHCESGCERSTIEASLPVDTRDEPRVANDIAMTSVTVEPTDTPATLRAKARASYERRMSSPAGIPEEILQVVGDRLAHRMAAGAGERDILCSNIGDLPEQLRTFGPHRCVGMAPRAIHPGLTVRTRPRTRLSGYLCRLDSDYTLCLVALDSPGIGSPDALTRSAARVAADLGLTPHFW